MSTSLKDTITSNGIALIGYFILVSIFYAPLLAGWQTFPDGDFTFHFLPFSIFQRNALLAGEWPLWNPYTYSGHPFLADIQAAVFYPLSNLVLLLTWAWESPAARLYWLQVEVVIHFCLAGFFTYRLVRDLTEHYEASASKAGAFLAGCAFAFSGYLTGYPPLQLAILRTAIWLPLVLCLLWRAARLRDNRGAFRWIIAASLAYACAFLAGHPQTFFFLSQVVAAWLLLLLLFAAHRVGYLLRVMVFYLLFLGLSAAQLWPSVEFTALSVRSEVDYAFLSGGFPLADTWQLLLPGVLTFFSPLYVGVVALGLGLLALLNMGRHLVAALGGTASDRSWKEVTIVAFFVLITLFFLLVSYGDNGFLYSVLYHWAVPGWDLFRGQERAAYIVAFGLSTLAGYGAVYLQTMSLVARRWAAGGFVLLATTGIALFGYFWQVPGRTDVNWSEFQNMASTIWLCVILFAIVLWTERLARWRLWLLVALVVGDLWLANFTTNLADGEPAQRLLIQPEIEALEAALSEAGTMNRVYNEYRVYEDYGMRSQAEDVWGSSPLRLAGYAALFNEFPLDRMWRLTGVEHVLTWRRELFEPSELLAEFPQATDTTYLHRLTEPNPRAWVVPRVQVVDDAEAVRLLADHSFDLEQIALLPPGEPTAFSLPPNGQLAPAGENKVDLQQLAPNNLILNVRSQQGGLLIVSENWMPGWNAWRIQPDNERQAIPLWRSNLSFLSIQIPAGQSQIELLYWPASVHYGLLTSGFTLVLLLVGFAIDLRKKMGERADGEYSYPDKFSR